MVDFNTTRYSTKDILVLADRLENSLSLPRSRTARSIKIMPLTKPKAMFKGVVAYTNIEANHYREKLGVLRIANLRDLPLSELERIAMTSSEAYLPQIVVEHIACRLVHMLYDVNEAEVFRNIKFNGIELSTKSLRIRILDKPETVLPKKTTDERSQIYADRLAKMDMDRTAYMRNLNGYVTWLKATTDKMYKLQEKARAMGLNPDFEIKPLKELLAEAAKDV